MPRGDAPQHVAGRDDVRARRRRRGSCGRCCGRPADVELLADVDVIPVQAGIEGAQLEQGEAVAGGDAAQRFARGHHVGARRSRRGRRGCGPRGRDGRRRGCGVGDVDHVARLEVLGIEMRVEFDHRVQIDAEAEADVEHRVARPHSDSARRARHEDRLADADDVEVQARVLGADRRKRGVELDGDAGRGVARLHGVAEDLHRRGLVRLGGCRRCRGGRAGDGAAHGDDLPDREAVRVERRVEILQPLDGRVMALGNAGEGVAILHRVGRAAGCGRGGLRCGQLDDLSRLDVVGRGEAAVGAEQRFIFEAEAFGDAGEGVAVLHRVRVGAGRRDCGEDRGCRGGRCEAEFERGGPREMDHCGVRVSIRIGEGSRDGAAEHSAYVARAVSPAACATL